MCLLCVVKNISMSQDNEDKETSTGKEERENRKLPVD